MKVLALVTYSLVITAYIYFIKYVIDEIKSGRPKELINILRYGEEGEINGTKKNVQ